MGFWCHHIFFFAECPREDFRKVRQSDVSYELRWATKPVASKSVPVLQFALRGVNGFYAASDNTNIPTVDQ